MVHGDRQRRCEHEIVGRVFRAQAERTKACDTNPQSKRHGFSNLFRTVSRPKAGPETADWYERVAPILSDGFIRPKTEKRSAGTNRPAITEAMTAPQKSLEDDETRFTILQNASQQRGHAFLRQDRFPTSCEEMQPLPLLTVREKDGKWQAPTHLSGA